MPFSSLRHVAFVFTFGAFALAGCAVDPTEASDTSEEDLSGRGGGGGAGFTCDGTNCTCSKEIEGDCDRMRINCWDTDALDDCIEGWATTDCSCPEVRTVSTPTSPVRAALGSHAGATLR